MAKKARLSPRKEPSQDRSIELRNSILEAATYLLRKNGARGFTTNKVADRAGVNIASVYQYYPNKDSLLFHLIELEWTSTFEAVYPILADESRSHAARLRLFIERFYETEMAESYLHEATRAAGLRLEDTAEYQALTAKADQVFTRFLGEALGSKSDLRRKSDFIQTVISSFSESLMGGPWPDSRADARLMAEMLIGHFGIRG